MEPQIAGHHFVKMRGQMLSKTPLGQSQQNPKWRRFNDVFRLNFSTDSNTNKLGILLGRPDFSYPTL